MTRSNTLFIFIVFINIIIVIFLVYILELQNPILIEDNISLTPQLQDLLAELEEKYK